MRPAHPVAEGRPESPTEFLGYVELKSVASWRPSKMVPVVKPILASPVAHRGRSDDSTEKIQTAFLYKRKADGSDLAPKERRLAFG